MITFHRKSETEAELAVFIRSEVESSSEVPVVWIQFPGCGEPYWTDGMLIPIEPAKDVSV